MHTDIYSKFVVQVVAAGTLLLTMSASAASPAIPGDDNADECCLLYTSDAADDRTWV